MDGFEFDTVTGTPALVPPEQTGRSYGLALSDDDQACAVEWQWMPDQLAQLEEFPFDQVISSDRPIHVRLWRGAAGTLHLRVG
jgi:hypothetical protein